MKYKSYQTRRLLRKCELSHRPVKIFLNFVTFTVLVNNSISKTKLTFKETSFKLMNILGHENISPETKLTHYVRAIENGDEPFVNLINGHHPDIAQKLVKELSLNITEIDLIYKKYHYNDIVDFSYFNQGLRREFISHVIRNPYLFCGEIIYLNDYPKISRRLFSKKLNKNLDDIKRNNVMENIMFLALSGFRAKDYEGYYKLLENEQCIHDTILNGRLEVVSDYIQNITKFGKHTINPLLNKKTVKQIQNDKPKGKRIDFKSERYETFEDRYNAMKDISLYHSDGLNPINEDIKVHYKKKKLI